MDRVMEKLRQRKMKIKVKNVERARFERGRCMGTKTKRDGGNSEREREQPP